MEKNIIDIIIEKVESIPNDQELGLEIRKEIYLYKERISKKPTPPLSRIILEGTVGDCPKCQTIEDRTLLIK